MTLWIMFTRDRHWKIVEDSGSFPSMVPLVVCLWL